MDIKLHCKEAGEGFPLILLHGNGEDGTYFVHQLEYFSPKFRVIAVDTRGHGLSPRGEAPFTIRQFADDLKEFLDELGIKKAHILGFSDGGNIALCFALKYPEYVEKLILNGANLNAKGVKPSVQLPIELGWRIARCFKKAKANAEMLSLMVNEPNIPESELSKIGMPTLVVAGSRDMIKDSHTRRIAELIPGAKLCIIEGDHFIANKCYGAFNAAVERFLDE